MGRKKRKHRARRHPQVDPQALYERGDYQGTISVLQKRIKRTPSDIDRRLLSESLLCSGDEKRISEALSLSLAIEHKSARDFCRAGWCYIQLKEWSKAVDAIEQSKQFGESAMTYYLLARAKAEGRFLYDLQEETKQAIQDLLRKAIELPNCHEGAFIWLEEFVRDWSDESNRERVHILQTGLSQHPNSEAIRYKLAQLYIYQLGAPETGLGVLDPLLLKTPPVWRGLWLAYETHFRLKHHSAAISFLDKLISEIAMPQLLIAKGLVLLEQTKTIEAVSCFENALIHDKLDEFSEKAVALFGIAGAYLRSGQADDVVRQLSRIVALINTAASSRAHFLLGSYVVNYWIDGEMEELNQTQFVAKVCKEILERTTDAADNESKGWLWYILYSIKRDFSAASEGEDEEESLSYLQNASLLLNHPAMSESLADYYLWEAEDIPKAVAHHLKSVLWRYSRHDPDEEFEDSGAEFETYNEDGDPDPIRVTRKKDRQVIHKLATDYLKDLGANQVKDIAIPFYKSFWRHMLIEGKMYKELSETTKFILSAQEDKSVLFDHAYGLQMLGTDEQAEKSYCRLVDLDPEHSSALHNLAIILNNRGELDRALELSNKALSLSANDENVVRLNKTLQQSREEAKTRRLIESGLLVTRVIRARTAQVPKPVFNSPREKLIYDLLIQLFPNHLVFPNMACSAIFDYDQMKGLLRARSDFTYFLMAIVDFCVVSTTDYMPFVAFEVDSKYHDAPEQSRKDKVKDKIFQLGGVSLIRLRPKAMQGASEMKLEIIRAVKYARVGLE